MRIRTSGSIEPLTQVSPGTKILGRVERMAVREGDRVQRGELLARLESRDLEAAVNQAEANLRMAEARVENARAQRDRMVTLHSSRSVTDKDLEDATTAFRVAEAAVDQAEANTAAARVTLGYAEIRSPLAGWGGRKKRRGGRYGDSRGSPFHYRGFVAGQGQRRGARGQRRRLAGGVPGAGHGPRPRNGNHRPI